MSNEAVRFAAWTLLIGGLFWTVVRVAKNKQKAIFTMLWMIVVGTIVGAVLANLHNDEMRRESRREFGLVP